MPSILVNGKRVPLNASSQSEREMPLPQVGNSLKEKISSAPDARRHKKNNFCQTLIGMSGLLVRRM